MPILQNRRAKPVNPQMGKLPPEYKIGQRAFYSTEWTILDQWKSKRWDERKKKGIVVIFTCLTTRAVHMK
jgi:hypothetical protein